MDPAFSSPRQAGAFALLLLLLLLLPVIAGKSFLPTREQMYSSSGRRVADFNYLHQQIFEEKSDIDIAIMGSSRLSCAINSSYLQEKLTERLGRQAAVRPITWVWNGYDAFYFIAQDLLQHRKVHMIVFCDLSYDLSPSAGDLAHLETPYWFRLADNAEALAGLPLKSKASFYANAVLGMPLNLLDLVRPNLPAIPSYGNGIAWNHSPTVYVPDTTTSPSNVRVYSNTTKSSFRFLERPISPMQWVFIHKIGALAHEYQAQLVFLHVPDFADRRTALIEETTFWPGAFRTNVAMIGIAPATLFAGMSDDDVDKLYHNPTHFSQNGQNYFTQIVTPSLVQIYEDQNKP